MTVSGSPVIRKSSLWQLSVFSVLDQKPCCGYILNSSWSYSNQKHSIAFLLFSYHNMTHIRNIIFWLVAYHDMTPIRNTIVFSLLPFYNVAPIRDITTFSLLPQHDVNIIRNTIAFSLLWYHNMTPISNTMEFTLLSYHIVTPIRDTMVVKVQVHWVLVSMAQYLNNSYDKYHKMVNRTHTRISHFSRITKLLR